MWTSQRPAVGSSDWLGLFLPPRPLIESSANKTRSFALGECGKQKILEHPPLTPGQCLRVQTECACGTELQPVNTLKPTIILEIIPRHIAEAAEGKTNGQMCIGEPPGAMAPPRDKRRPP